jgi:hypothetical protein
VTAWLLALALAAPATIPAPTNFDQLPSAERATLADARTLWPQLPEAERERLRAQARHWLALDAAGRARLVAAIDAWNALPPTEKASRRARFAAWQQLSPAEQARVRAAAARLAALTEAERSAVRARFAALPPAERERWRLGPALAPHLDALRGLVDFVPAAEQAPLVAALRALPEDALAALAALAPKLSATRVQELRKELLAAPVEGRGDVVARWTSAG